MDVKLSSQQTCQNSVVKMLSEARGFGEGRGWPPLSGPVPDPGEALTRSSPPATVEQPGVPSSGHSEAPDRRTALPGRHRLPGLLLALLSPCPLPSPVRGALGGC